MRGAPRRSLRATMVAVAVAAIALTACSSSPARVATSSPGVASRTAGSSAAGNAGSGAVHRSTAGHVVVVVLENHSYADVVGNRAAPYLTALARQGTSLTDMHAVTHPSEPNYVALFSGTTHGVTNDDCPLHLSGQTLGDELRQAGMSFTGYSEGLPDAGSAVCTAGSYARKHVPWTDFASLPSSVNQPFMAFPTNFATLPTVAFVIPNLDHDMHDGTVGQADTWIRQHLDRYATWARTHHSLLVITWDEDDRSENNRIPTFVVGANVPPKQVSNRLTSYSLLRALEDRYTLPRLGASASAPALSLP